MTSISVHRPESRRAAKGEAGVAFYDDARARSFEPFALTRPACTLVAGTKPIWARFDVAVQMPLAGVIVADHLTDFEEDVLFTATELAAGTIVVNSRFAPRLDGPSVQRDDDVDAWFAEGRAVAVRLTRAMQSSDFKSGSLALDSLVERSAARRELLGWWHEEVWDFLRFLPEMLTSDLSAPSGLPDRVDAYVEDLWKAPAHAIVLGNGRARAFRPLEGSDDPPAIIEPQVVLDTTNGPIFIDSGAHVHSFTRINGPCYVGPGAIIMGGDITGCSIGRVSKIRGEISGSIVLGYSNKGHDGFVGNSYLGRWVNLGAGTTTSNLKNTYGPVSLWTPTGVRPTGMQFLGTLFGDHVKTGIGTNLTTGTVLGAGTNVFGATMPPKVVAPFSWGSGEPYDVYALDKFLSSATTVMARRKQTLTDRMKRQLSASFERRWSAK